MAQDPQWRRSSKQKGRLLLPQWLRGATDDMLRAEYAIGMGDASLAASPGKDVPDAIVGLVSEADPTLRASCRRHLLSYSLAPHARWEDGEAPIPAPMTPSITELEARLEELAEGGDRAAILALLAALDPARYGRHAAPAPDGGLTDVVDWAATTTPA